MEGFEDETDLSDATIRYNQFIALLCMILLIINFQQILRPLTYDHCQLHGRRDSRAKNRRGQLHC